MQTKKQTRCFLVEDTESIRRSLSRYLEKKGWAVTTARNGSEALTLFQKALFDVIILDVELGDGPNGIALAETFRAEDPNARILMTSGNENYEEKIKEKNVGPFFLKPVDPDLFISAVQP